MAGWPILWIAAVAALLPPSAPVSCSLGDVHLEAITPREWLLPQVGAGSNKSLFWWNLGFCDRVAAASVTNVECNSSAGVAGYFQQFDDQTCVADFTEWLGIVRNASGVTLRAATGTGGAGRREKVMNFFIECDPLAEGTQVWYVRAAVDVQVVGNTEQYHISARSHCACPNAPGCDQAPARENDPTPPEALPGEAEALLVHPCVVGGVDLSGLPPKEFVLRQNWTNEYGFRNLEEYVWVVGFCSKVFEAPTGTSPCEFEGGAGFLQQYSGTTCRADFNIWGGLEVDPAGNGVTVTVEQEDGWRFRKTAYIHIVCNPHGHAGHSGVAMTEVPVLTDPKDEDHLIYHLELRSKCACRDACPHQEPVPPKLPDHPVVIPASQRHPCHIAGIDLGGLPVTEFIAPEHLDGYAEDSFVWLVGWCTPVEVPTLAAVGEADPCDFDGGFGYLQQFKQDRCVTDFNEFVDLAVTTGGIQITVRSRHTEKLVKTARIQVTCDDDGLAGEVTPTFDKVRVLEVDGQHREYLLTFKSRCACPDGCPHRAVPEPSPSPPPPPEPERTCVIGDVDLRSVPPADLVLYEKWASNASAALKPSLWTIGFCGPAHPVDESPCQGAEAYAQQHDGDHCEAQFTEWRGMRVVDDGVQFEMETLPDVQQHIRRLHIDIRCDKTRLDYDTYGKRDVVAVQAVAQGGAHYRVYRVELFSRCACPGLCRLPDVCGIGEVHLQGLPTMESELPLSHDHQTYSWVIGWCRNVTAAPATEDPCSASPGIVHMYRGDWCFASFREDFTMFSTPKGIVVSASAPGSPLRVVQVLLRCDATLSSLDVVEDRDVVEVESEILDQTIATFYRLYYRSRCACPGGCANTAVVDFDPAPRAPSPAPGGDPCRVGAVDLSAVPLLEVSLRVENGPSSIWAIGFCHRVFDPPTGITPCDTEYGAGYVQMFNEVQCQGDFGAQYSLSATSHGVQIVAHNPDAAVVIDVLCDPALMGPQVVVDDPLVRTSLAGHKVSLGLRFRSKCACPHGCAAASAPTIGPRPPPPAPDVVPAPLIHHAHPCIVTTDAGERLDLSHLPPLEFPLRQHLAGRPDEVYVWVIGWCTSVLQAPTGATPCAQQSGWGYLQQFRRDRCEQDFRDFLAISAVGKGDQSEVVILYSGKSHDGVASTAVVTVRCAAEASSDLPAAHVVGQEMNVSQRPLGGHDPAYTYTLHFRSPCACPGRCAVPTASPGLPPPRAAASPHPAVPGGGRECQVNGRDLQSLPPSEFVWPVINRSGAVDPTQYVWVFGWCAEVSDPPTKAGAAADPCSFGEGPGFLQQFRAGRCQADFNADLLVAEEAGGVRLTYVDPHSGGATRKRAVVHVKCDRALRPGLVAQDSDGVRISAGAPSEEVYEFHFRSRCACVGGCGGGGCGPACLTAVSLTVLVLGYLVLGVAYNKVARNATTLEELLPNRLFWQRVPGRCMACGSSVFGFVFARCCGRPYRRVTVLDDEDGDLLGQEDGLDFL